MSLRGKATFHLHSAGFTFSHTFIICGKLQETNFLFGINLQKRYSLSHCWDLDRQLSIYREGSFLTYTRNSSQHHNIAVVKSTLKILPRHNGAIPIRIKGHKLRDQVAHFISSQNTKKGFDSNIHVTDSIYDIKNTSTLHVHVSKYANKHVTFNKGQCIGHMELSIDNKPQISVNSIITQKMIHKQVHLDTFKPPVHTFHQK